MIKHVLISCLIAASTTAACTSAARRTPETTPATEVERAKTAPVVSARPPRPLHKGHVDVSTGLYIREDDDLIVPTSMPIVLRRTYLVGDRKSRHFGIGATHPGEWWLYGDGDPRIPWADLILADGGRIHFTRISSGDSQVGAVLRHDTTRTTFNGALLSWSGSKWEMRFRDGSMAFFQDCQGPQDVCWLLERRDANGHRIEYVRDASGTLLKMESDGQRIAFEYEDHRRNVEDRLRIVRAADTSQRVMVYSYDDRGRLTRATASDGTVRTYTYDERDELIAVREPGRIVENEFDPSGRLARQVVKGSDHDDDPYVMTFRYVVDGGAVVRADVGEDDGTTTVFRFNNHHHVLSETHDADGPAPITFTYDRSASTDVTNGVMLSCLGPAGPITRVVQLASDDDEDTKARLMREGCAPPK